MEASGVDVYLLVSNRGALRQLLDALEGVPAQLSNQSSTAAEVAEDLSSAFKELLAAHEHAQAADARRKCAEALAWLQHYVDLHIVDEVVPRMCRYCTLLAESDGLPQGAAGGGTPDARRARSALWAVLCHTIALILITLEAYFMVLAKSRMEAADALLDEMERLLDQPSLFTQLAHVLRSGAAQQASEAAARAAGAATPEAIAAHRLDMAAAALAVASACMVLSNNCIGTAMAHVDVTSRDPNGMATTAHRLSNITNSGLLSTACSTLLTVTLPAPPPPPSTAGEGGDGSGAGGGRGRVNLSYGTYGTALNHVHSAIEHFLEGMRNLQQLMALVVNLLEHPAAAASMGRVCGPEQQQRALVDAVVGVLQQDVHRLQWALMERLLAHGRVDSPLPPDLRRGAWWLQQLEVERDCILLPQPQGAAAPRGQPGPQAAHATSDLAAEQLHLGIVRGVLYLWATARSAKAALRGRAPPAGRRAGAAARAGGAAAAGDAPLEHLLNTAQAAACGAHVARALRSLQQGRGLGGSYRADALPPHLLALPFLPHLFDAFGSSTDCQHEEPELLRKSVPELMEAHSHLLAMVVGAVEGGRDAQAAVAARLRGTGLLPDEQDPDLAMCNLFKPCCELRLPLDSTSWGFRSLSNDIQLWMLPRLAAAGLPASLEHLLRIVQRERAARVAGRATQLLCTFPGFRGVVFGELDVWTTTEDNFLTLTASATRALAFPLLAMTRFEGAGSGGAGAGAAGAAAADVRGVEHLGLVVGLSKMCGSVASALQALPLPGTPQLPGAGHPHSPAASRVRQQWLSAVARGTEAWCLVSPSLETLMGACEAVEATQGSAPPPAATPLQEALAVLLRAACRLATTLLHHLACEQDAAARPYDSLPRGTALPRTTASLVVTFSCSMLAKVMQAVEDRLLPWQHVAAAQPQQLVGAVGRFVQTVVEDGAGGGGGAGGSAAGRNAGGVDLNIGPLAVCRVLAACCADEQLCVLSRAWLAPQAVLQLPGGGGGAEAAAAGAAAGGAAACARRYAAALAGEAGPPPGGAAAAGSGGAGDGSTPTPTATTTTATTSATSSASAAGTAGGPSCGRGRIVGDAALLDLVRASPAHGRLVHRLLRAAEAGGTDARSGSSSSLAGLRAAGREALSSLEALGSGSHTPPSAAKAVREVAKERVEARARDAPGAAAAGGDPAARCDVRGALPPAALVPVPGLQHLRLCGNPRCGTWEGASEAGLPLLQCGSCRTVRYCGVECQRAHWKGGHKTECAVAKAAATGA